MHFFRCIYSELSKLLWTLHSPTSILPNPRRTSKRQQHMASSSSTSSSSASSSGADVVCKLILVGNGSAGKTSICGRFKDDGFKRVYRQTVGVDFYERNLNVRGREVSLQVWDIGGQSIGSGMLSRYIGGASVVFVCYDVTDAQSFADA